MLDRATDVRSSGLFLERRHDKINNLDDTNAIKNSTSNQGVKNEEGHETGKYSYRNGNLQVLDIPRLNDLQNVSI